MINCTGSDNGSDAQVVGRLRIFDVLRVAAVSGFSYVLYSAAFVFFNSFASLLTHTPMSKIMASNTAMMLFDVCLLMVLGRLMCNIPCRPLLRVIIAGTIITTPLLFLTLPHLEFIGFCTTRIVLVILGVAFCIPINRWYMEEFSATHRYQTTALGYAIGSETLGRTYPAVGLALWHYTNSPIVPGLYLALIGVFAFLALGLPGQRHPGQRHQNSL